MSQRTRAMMAGLPAQAANMLCTGATLTGQTATGTSSQSAALAIAPNTNMLFSTVAANSGARLPYTTDSGPIYIYNDGANALLLYPSTGQTINASSANSSFSVTNAKGAMCWPLSTGWAVVLSA